MCSNFISRIKSLTLKSEICLLFLSFKSLDLPYSPSSDLLYQNSVSCFKWKSCNLKCRSVMNCIYDALEWFDRGRCFRIGAARVGHKERSSLEMGKNLVEK